jgi:hypothetical protein
MVEGIHTASSKKVKAVFCSSGEKQTENWKDSTPNNCMHLQEFYYLQGEIVEKTTFR